jgi:hypothetical protein
MAALTLVIFAIALLTLSLGCAEGGDRRTDHSTATHEAFDLDNLQWQRRPLVLIAPSGDNPALGEQQRIAEADAAGFAERDMTIVEVVGETVRVAGERRRADAAALRQRMDADGATFAARLVGKDGGIKLRADEPISADRLFEVIDAMPMRQAEMRDR